MAELLRRLSVLAAKVETTPGTAISTSGTDGAFNVFGASIQPTMEFQQREGAGSFSPMSGRLGPASGSCSFSVELTGDGAAGVPQWATTFLPACGFVNSGGTFSPKSEAPGSNVKTLTFDYYQNGLRKTLFGAVGTFSLLFPTRRICMVNFNFTGIYDETPSDTAIIAPNYPDNLSLRFSGATCTIGGYAPKVSAVNIDINNQLVLREDCSTAWGFSAGVIAGRRPTGSLDPEMTLVATKDWHNEWTGHEEQALSIIVGSANNQVTIAAPKLQYTNLQASSRNDVLTENLEFQLNRSADAGNDEITIAFA